MSIIHFCYTRILKPLLFRFTDPEDAHDWFIALGHSMGAYSLSRWALWLLFGYEHPKLSQTIHNITFTSPVGLSAGFDKDGKLVNLYPALGFGFAQIGTVTLKPYAGNPKPRAVRLPRSRSILVNYGLKNEGVDVIAKRIKQSRQHCATLGISFGRTNAKETAELEAGIADIQQCLHRIIEHDIGNIYTLNISCPNLYGGESFYNPKSLEALLEALHEEPIDRPLYIKMPIHLPWEEFEQLLVVAKRFGVAGLVIGNLHKDRSDPALKDPIPDVSGSFSGTPAKRLSNELIEKTYRAYGDTFTIIGVGGIFSADDAYEKIRKGASLVQVITGLIYEGPQLVSQINKGLVKRMKRDGFSHISEAVGADHR